MRRRQRQSISRGLVSEGEYFLADKRQRRSLAREVFSAWFSPNKNPYDLFGSRQREREMSDIKKRRLRFSLAVGHS
jgi:hypothetical protein